MIAGSTRMKAAAAQKMALTMLSTAIMVKLGKVHGNLMVDLRASNRKLRARAERLTLALSGASPDEVTKALEACGYLPKVAVVMLKNGCSAAQAQAFVFCVVFDRPWHPDRPVLDLGVSASGAGALHRADL